MKKKELVFEFQLENEIVRVYVDRHGNIFKMTFKGVDEVYAYDPLVIEPLDNKEYFDREVERVCIEMQKYNEKVYNDLLLSLNYIYHNIAITKVFICREYNSDGNDITRMCYINGLGNVVRIEQMFTYSKEDKYMLATIKYGDVDFSEMFKLFTRRFYELNGEEEFNEFALALNEVMRNRFLKIKYIPL